MRPLRTVSLPITAVRFAGISGAAGLGTPSHYLVNGGGARRRRRPAIKTFLGFVKGPEGQKILAGL